MTTKPTALHLFCGIGGGALGFRRAGFESVGAFDLDEVACRDFARIVGEDATCADLGEMTPDELREACTGRPDVVFTSPPCVAFSGCLPVQKSVTPEYRAISNLALRGVWLSLEAWADSPPPLFVLENVPRIQSRGRYWLDQLGGLLRSYGYAVRETTHNCGELGGLAQNRHRFLLVARHTRQVPEFLYEPPKRSVRGVGEVLGRLPVPVPTPKGQPIPGGPMHELPRLSAMNWLRLALIPAGGDWRDLPESVELAPRDGRQNGGFGVTGWDDPAHSVVAEGTVRNTWSSVADPRLSCAPRNGAYGVVDAEDASGVVVAAVCHDNSAASWGDPRVTCQRREGSLGVTPWDGTITAVIGAAQVHNHPCSVADPRLSASDGRHEAKYGLAGWEDPTRTVIGTDRLGSGAASVADPRLDHEPRKGTMGVTGWAEPSHVIIGDARTNKGANVADPRVPVLVGPALDLDDKRPTQLVIQAADGTWHRPMTDLELFCLQGFDGVDVVLEGSRKVRRQHIGNCVPVHAAEAIAIECRITLEAAREGRLLLSGQPVWVDRQRDTQRADEAQGDDR